MEDVMCSDEKSMRSPSRRNKTKIIALNTPSKSDLNQKEDANSEFDF